MNPMPHPISRRAAPSSTPAGHALRVASAFTALALLAGCASGSGPSAGALERSAVLADTGDSAVVDLASYRLPYAPDGGATGLAGLGGARFDGSMLRPGDTVQVKIFDTGEEGLVSSASSSQLELGSFRVDQNGYINVPYAGRVRAAGGSAAALQDRIAAGLRGSSVSPQASVFVSESGGSGFTVNGAVNGAGRYDLSAQSERVLDAIAMAGGPSSPAGESQVTLIRGSNRASVPMDRLLAEPAQNVYVQPGDQIFVQRDTTSFTAFGAFKSPGEFNFQPGALTFAQGVARAGGLLDDRANAKRIYLMRYESASVARSLGVLPPESTFTGPVPVIYRADMTQPQALFQMQSFPLQKSDMLYVPNTASANLGKAFQIFQKSPPTAAAPLPE